MHVGGAAAAEDEDGGNALVPKGDLLATDGSWWERRVVGWPKDKPTGTRSVYVNHKTKEAAWTPPPAWAAWELLRQPIETARFLVMPQLLLAYKELFRISGDKNAELYTGSPAMHSAQLDLLLVRTVLTTALAESRVRVRSACSASLRGCWQLTQSGAPRQCRSSCYLSPLAQQHQQAKH